MVFGFVQHRELDDRWPFVAFTVFAIMLHGVVYPAIFSSSRFSLSEIVATDAWPLRQLRSTMSGTVHSTHIWYHHHHQTLSGVYPSKRIICSADIKIKKRIFLRKRTQSNSKQGFCHWRGLRSGEELSRRNESFETKERHQKKTAVINSNVLKEKMIYYWYLVSGMLALCEWEFLIYLG